jgi:hypothetical protein
MSPDGQRFVLKPLPHQPSVDDAEAEGFNFFGNSKSGSKSGLFASGQPRKSFFGGGTAQNAGVGVVNPSGKNPGLFDWASYRKQQQQQQQQQQAAVSQPDGTKVTIKKLKKKPGSPTVQSASASADSAALEKLIKIPPKAKVAKVKKPVVDCKADPSGKDCKPEDVTPTAADATTPVEPPKT